MPGPFTLGVHSCSLQGGVHLSSYALVCIGAYEKSDESDAIDEKSAKDDLKFLENLLEIESNTQPCFAEDGFHQF